MKKNNIRKIAVMLALVQALTLGGCKSNNAASTNKNDFANAIENHDWNKEWDELKYKWENETTVYKLIQERFNPIVTYNNDGTISYSAPAICNMITGSGSNMECYYVHYEEVSKEECESVLPGTISRTSYCDEMGVHETYELAPVVIYNEDGTTSYRAPSSATRVEGSGSNMRCYVDYLHTITDNLEYENQNELKLSK